MAASPGDYDPLNRSLANEAGLAFPSVHPVFQLENALFALGVNIIGDRRSAQFDRLPENFLHRSKELCQLLARNGGSTAPWANSGTKKRLVRVDVPHASQQLLIE